MNIERRVIICFLFLASLFVGGCDTATESTGSSASGLTFIHVNDTYRVGAVEEGKAGGFGRVVTVIRQLQSQGRDVRVLHAGDFLYSSL
ncbi:MAG: hypothetical protein ACE5OQ_16735, partial [Woeseia sp.]